MKLPKETAVKIARDAGLSIFIYALPVLLMFLTFYFTGQKPWVKQAAPANSTQTSSTTTTKN